MRRGLLTWFRKNGRDLPWRKTSDPYAIVVSEIMLQQTQVDRVIPKYHAFLKKFPGWRALAKASQASVVKIWHGLGYNRRAMMLHKLARQLASSPPRECHRSAYVLRRDGSLRLPAAGQHAPPFVTLPSADGRGEPKLPSAFEELITLPGIGTYTAQAVRAFAFRKPDAAPVDTNIERILKRVFGSHDKNRKTIDALALDVLPTDVWSWNHAMMDLGATVCTARSPKCAVCPLRSVCMSYPCAGDDVKKRPQKKFADSDRMFRGRIVARLRGKAYDTDALQKAVELDDHERFGRLVDSLVAEGLVASKNGKLCLR